MDHRSDLTPYEVVQVDELNASSFQFMALNETVTSISVQNPTNVSTFDVSSGFDWTTIDHNLVSETFLIIDFYNGNVHVHRWSRVVLSD